MTDPSQPYPQHRLALVRAYFYLAILSTATVCAAAVLRGVVYFVYAVR